MMDIIAEALKLGREALRDALRSYGGEIYGRGAYGDLTFKFDIVVEDAIIKYLREKIPSSTIISEEKGVIEASAPEYFILIDPVDGSKNASRGIPFYASSIVVSKSPRISDIIAAGLIDHVSGDLYLGERDVGVLVNGERPRLSQVKSLKDAIMLIDHASFKAESPEVRAWAIKLLSSLKASRFLASAGLEIAYILSGRVEGFACLGKSLKLMDFLASTYLLELAGGSFKISDSEKTLSLMDRRGFSVIATANQELLEEVLRLKH